MSGIKDALLRMIRAARRIKEVEEKYVDAGLNSDPLFESYGDILDAIYYLIGEDKKGLDEFRQSATFTTMTAPILSNERRTEMLMAEYMKNHPEEPEQPKPNTIDPKQMKELYRRNGGYMYFHQDGRPDYRRELKDCKNELCLKCGRYKDIFDDGCGCGDCRWKGIDLSYTTPEGEWT